MRFGNPKYVVILGMVSFGIFLLVFLFSFLDFPSTLSGFKLSPFSFTTPFDTKTPYSVGTYENELDENNVSIPSQITQIPSDFPQIPVPTFPEKFKTSVALNEEQINQLVKLAVGNNQVFSDPYVSLNGDTMSLTAKLLSPIKGNFSAVVIIKPGNNAINIDLTEAKVNNIPIPGFLLATVEDELNKSINNTLGSIEFLKIEKVYVYDSKLIIEGSIPTKAFFDLLSQ